MIQPRGILGLGITYYVHRTYLTTIVLYVQAVTYTLHITAKFLCTCSHVHRTYCRAVLVRYRQLRTP